MLVGIAFAFGYCYLADSAIKGEVNSKTANQQEVVENSNEEFDDEKNPVEPKKDKESYLRDY